MYSLTSANRYYLYQGFVRMNLGIDGLFKIIRLEMKDLSPVSGDIFLFFGKLHLVCNDHHGHVLVCQLPDDAQHLSGQLRVKG